MMSSLQNIWNICLNFFLPILMFLSLNWLCWQMTTISYGFRDKLNQKIQNVPNFAKFELSYFSFIFYAYFCKLLIILSYLWDNKVNELFFLMRNENKFWRHILDFLVEFISETVRDSGHLSTQSIQRQKH
jgi:hypothetical protein